MEALRDGALLTSARWFERASRLAPHEPTPLLLLASAVLDSDPDRATDILERAAAAHPRSRDVRVGLAAVRLRQGDSAGAAGLIAALLSRDAPPRTATFRAFAGTVAQASGAPGWVGADASGHLTVALVGEPAAGHVLVDLDGQSYPLAQTRRYVRHRLHPGWRSIRMATVTSGGQQLLGSPIALSALCRVEGVVRADPDGGISGSVWVAGDPDAVPVVTTVTSGRRAACRATRRATRRHGSAPTSARHIRLPPSHLESGAAVHVLDPEGRDLLGSPLYLAGPPPPPPPAPHRPARARTLPGRAPIDIVIPVFRGVADLAACLATVWRGLPSDVRVVIVDDGSHDAALDTFLSSPAVGQAIVLRHADNRGFPAAANTGLRYCTADTAAPRDVLLLNSDTLLPADVPARLAEAAYSFPDIGSVTPMSNDGTIVSCDVAGFALRSADVDRIDAGFAAANAGLRTTIPTGVGFCLFLRHDCLADVGMFREDVFAQGYGEENDWCLRAARRGWRHLADTGVFVGHAGGRSFGAARFLLMDRNHAVLARLHPDYDATVERFCALDPLRPHRRRVAALRWSADRADQRSVILVTHDWGGGTERRVLDRCDELAAEGMRPVVLRLAAAGPGGSRQVCEVSAGRDRRCDLAFCLPDELPDLVALLRDDRPRSMEIHHLGGFPPDIVGLSQALDIPYDVAVHDYAMVCPRMTFCGSGGRYCGEPSDPAACEACVAENGSRLHERIPVDRLRARSAAMIGAARTVFVPSEDVGRRLRRYVRGVQPVVTTWEPRCPSVGPTRIAARGSEVRVCVVGAIGQDKGYDVLLQCAEDARARRLPLQFTLVGHSIDDARLLQTGRVFVTGAFAEAEAVTLIRRQSPHIGWLPSVCPETWSFALSTMWRAGLRVTSFAIGTPAERIAATGQGWVIPLGAPPARINALLLGFGGADRPSGSGSDVGRLLTSEAAS